MTRGVAAPGPTIGVIMDHVAGESRSSLWPGIAEPLQAYGGNLLCFTGGTLHDPHNFSAQGNIVYDFIDVSRLDGLIIWSSSLSSYVGYDTLRHFCDRYRPLPIVSIGVVLDGIPSVVLDSYQGMREAMAHLIEVHGRRRLAFIRGPQGHRDADERYRAYLDALKEHGLPVVPDLVSPNYKWFDPGGRDMMHRLLDGRRVAFDAVVCVNDDLAAQAMEVLQARGVRVPEDVSVVGFNDTPVCKVVTPPLTSVPWRMYERGQYAAKLMLALLAGESAPAQVLVPARLTVRQSCGCLDPAVAQARVEPVEQPIWVVSEENASVHETLVAGRAGCLAAIEQTIEENERKPEWIAELLDAFLGELHGESAGGFLPALEEILRQVMRAGSEISVWQRVISALRSQTLPVLTGDRAALMRAEDLWHQARVMIGEQTQRARGYRGWLAQQHAERLRRISHVLAKTTRVPDLMDVLAEELPQVGIKRCYLALYEAPLESTEWCDLVLAYDEGGRRDLPPEERRVRAQDLAMGALLPPDQPFSMLIQPLHFGDEQLGLVMFDQQPAGDIYTVLQEEISVTLKAVLLAERNVELYQQAVAAEQVAQDGRRLAEEADRLKSRFLSMVSHELRTPLVLLVGLSEMMLRERTGDHRPPLPEPYRQDLARIHVGAQQLDSLVRDVLDLTRSQRGQLLLAMERLDLAKVIRAVALVGEQMARDKGLGWRLETPEHLPPVSGDPARLQQVMLNLITNAVKFTSCGEITLSAIPHAAFGATIDPNVGQVANLSYQPFPNAAEEAGAVTVLVSDTGLGVPEAEQDAIFDEFRQSERTAARGYGGLGIGLALCREIIDLHGGQIGVRSSGEEQSGATFFFTLPVIHDASKEQPGPQPDSQAVVLLTTRAGSGGRLETHLVNEGFQVECLCVDETSDWQAQVLALSPGAIVLDCAPDSARGWQLIETLKQHPSTQDIPVLFYALPVSPEHGAGSLLALDHLTKPLGAATLAHALQRYGLGADRQAGMRTVLVVDDDPSIREMHGRVVQTALPDSRVLQASNGRIALEIMQHDRPALVLLDLMMPEMGGMGVLAAMQADEKLRGVPVIVLTAATLAHEEMAQLTRGVAAVLQKGMFTAEETLAHIEQALARDRRLGSETQRLVRRAMAYIHEHYAEPLGREDVASHVGVSARHLTRCFQQEVGLSPIAYLNRYRVRQAKRLLEAGDSSITAVADAVGFASSGYFTDAFRREVGMSPREYQRRNLAPNS